MCVCVCACACVCMCGHATVLLSRAPAFLHSKHLISRLVTSLQVGPIAPHERDPPPCVACACADTPWAPSLNFTFLPTHLKTAAGYGTTAMFGKWHLGMHQEKY